MNTEIVSRLSGRKLNIWTDFLKNAALEADMSVKQTVLVWDGDSLIATGSRDGNVLKCIAVDSARQGEGLTSTVITELRKSAFEEGFTHLFLYTKPKNRDMFSSLFFYPVEQTGDVLLMESIKDGMENFLDTLPIKDTKGVIGSVVMNCNPFTLGHLYLVETAAADCDHLYIFVLSEDKSKFSAEDRINMVRLGTRHLKNVTVLPTGPYMISSATFPTYFLKNRESAVQVQCGLDIEIFTKHYAPKFSITKRYVGSEPLSPMTAEYNRALKENLPQRGIELIEIPRLENSGNPISASYVRKLLESGELDEVKKIVPSTTYEYIKVNKLF